MSLTISQIVKNIVDVNDIKHDRKYSRVAKLHKYWSRKPWFVVDQYIEKYSKKNHVVLDPFCGSGIIGLQSVLADRNFIGYDLNPFAVFLAKNSMDVSYDQVSFEDDFSVIKQTVREKIMSLYATKDKYILYTILGKKNSKDYNAVIADSSFRNKQKVSLSQKELEPTIKFPKSLKYPDMDFPKKFYKDRFSYKGVKRVSDMFTKRNLFALATLHTAINALPLKNRDLFMLAFTNTLLHVSKLKAENVRPLGVNNFWIPDDFIEENVWWRFVDRVNNVKMAKVVISEKASRNRVSKPSSKIYNKSSLKMKEVKPSSVDYLITDPPYGDTIQYSELSYIWNCWLDKDLKIWISLAELIRDHGMELVDISSYDTFGSPYNKNWAKFSPKSDFYVTFVNSQNKTKPKNKKAIYPNEIADEIVKCLGKNNDKLFNLNKTYDLFVGVVISKIFEGSQVAEHERMSIENITNLFQDVPREEKREQKKKEVQQSLFKLQHI